MKVSLTPFSTPFFPLAMSSKWVSFFLILLCTPLLGAKCHGGDVCERIKKISESGELKSTQLALRMGWMGLLYMNLILMVIRQKTALYRNVGTRVMLNVNLV